MRRWPGLLLLAACLAAVPCGSARAQDGDPDEEAADSVSTCGPADSAAVDSAVQVALAAERGPKPIEPKLIVVERALSPTYNSLDEARWQWVDVGSGVRLSVAPIHTDPATRVRQLLLRLPANAVVPAHWHGAHETLLVISGALVVRDEKNRVVRLAAGGFSFEPAAAPHSLATGADTGALVLITSEGTWDIHLPEERGNIPADQGSSVGPRFGDTSSRLP